MFGCLCGPTSPGIVVVGHSVCGLDGGEAGLQGEQLTGQVWHTKNKEKGRFTSQAFNVIYNGDWAV